MESNIWKCPFHCFKTNSYVEVFDPVATHSFGFLKWERWRVCGALSNFGVAFSESGEQDGGGRLCEQVASHMFCVCTWLTGPHKPHSNPISLAIVGPLWTSSFSLCSMRVGPRSHPVLNLFIHLTNYLWNTYCMPGSITGVTLQFKKRLHFMICINYGGKVLLNSSSQSDLFSQLASNSNKTLGHLPCNCPGNTPQVCGSAPGFWKLPSDTANGIQTSQPSWGCWAAGGLGPYPDGWSLPGRSLWLSLLGH